MTLGRPAATPGSRQPSVDVTSTFSMAEGFLGGVGSDDAGVADDGGEEDVEVPCKEGCACEKRGDWGRQSQRITGIGKTENRVSVGGGDGVRPSDSPPKP